MQLAVKLGIADSLHAGLHETLAGIQLTSADDRDDGRGCLDQTLSGLTVRLSE